MLKASIANRSTESSDVVVIQEIVGGASITDVVTVSDEESVAFCTRRGVGSNWIRETSVPGVARMSMQRR